MYNYIIEYIVTCILKMLKQAPTKQKSVLTQELRQEIDEAFQLFDINKDGFLDYHELKYAS